MKEIYLGNGLYKGVNMRKAKTVDYINSPPHYNNNPGMIECIDAIQAMLSPEEYVGYLRGNSLKYRWRFRYKNGVEDLKKAKWYENRLEEAVNKLDNSH